MTKNNTAQKHCPEQGRGADRPQAHTQGARGCPLTAKGPAHGHQTKRVPGPDTHVASGDTSL